MEILLPMYLGSFGLTPIQLFTYFYYLLAFFQLFQLQLDQHKKIHEVPRYDDVETSTIVVITLTLATI
jgi:hypothetical protein